MKNSSFTYSQFSDEQLMQLFQSNRSQDVFSEIYDRYFKVLCRYVHWTSNGTLSSEDIAQDILVKLFHQPDIFDSTKNLKVWLFVAAKNRIKNNHRNNLTQKAHQAIIRQSIETHTSITGDRAEGQQHIPIEKLVQKLSEDHKEVVILKYSNNLTIPEISEVLDISRGTVKSRLFYALQKMRSHLPKKQTS